MPYVVIEAAAAGVPMIAANVGGIPEIFGPHADALFSPNSAGAMAEAIETALDDPASTAARAKTLRERIFMHFSQKAMVEGILASYGEAFAKR
jgi:glycosyltransferase involved in cell wall biosynthesis